VLTLFAGLMSGLTVGYLSIDDLVLELKTSTGSGEEKAQAYKVLPILAHRHWLLCTLLISNAAAMETLPIFLNYLVPEYLAIIISVTLVLTFGEIIPQAICTGPDQVKIAAYLAPFTKVNYFNFSF
jgi:metal transporter CNNM